VHHTLSLPLLPPQGRTPHALPLLQRGVPPMGDSPLRTAPAWVPSTGCSPSGTGCSSVGPPQGHKFCQQTCSGMGFSLHGATGPGRSLLQHGLSMESQPPSGILLLKRKVFHGLQVEICSTMDLHGLQGQNLPHHGLLHGLRGNPAPGALPPPPSSLTLVSAVLVLPRILTRLLSCKMPLCSFSPLLKYVITEVLPLSLMGSALASGGSVLEPAGIGFIRHGGSFWQLLTEATPIAPPLPKPCHANPVLWVMQNHW